MRKQRRTNWKRRCFRSLEAWKHRLVLRRRYSARGSLQMPKNCFKRSPILRTVIQKYFSCCQKPMPGLGGGKMRNALHHGPRHYKNRNGRNKRPTDGIKASFVASRENSEELLLHRH